MANRTLYMKHCSGAIHEYGGRRAAKLKKELEAGRGGPEVTALVENDYEGFLGPDGEIWCFEALKPEHII